MSFNSVIHNVMETSNQVNCTGAGVMLMHKGEVVVEKYWGKQSNHPNARNIQPDTQFHIASVRKSYIGYAVAYAVYHGYIQSIDDPITHYLPLANDAVYNGVLIRHLLTHTHGLTKKDHQIQQEFAPGTSWAYRGAAIEILTDLVEKTTGKTVAMILQETIFEPLQLVETGWYSSVKENFVDVINAEQNPHWYTSENVDGSQMNMYVSIRDLIRWGQLHLQKGRWNGQQVVDEELIEIATSIQSPTTLPLALPQNGFFWFAQKDEGIPSDRMELSLQLPAGSYQLLGYTNVTLLVIPQYEVVAVRAFNSFGSAEGFDYIKDVRTFGDIIMEVLKDGI
ncbi:serine hydrolase domain-containing protein [Lederbergia citrisecunda]|uniref:serine hydrolase domain-containing protein n=1 Tax=Lederbergia citrisecunda TaxID=2833583 RepID=UPI0032E7FDAC